MQSINSHLSSAPASAGLPRDRFRDQRICRWCDGVLCAKTARATARVASRQRKWRRRFGEEFGENSPLPASRTHTVRQTTCRKTGCQLTRCRKTNRPAEKSGSPSPHRPRKRRPLASFRMKSAFSPNTKGASSNKKKSAQVGLALRKLINLTVLASPSNQQKSRRAISPP